MMGENVCYKNEPAVGSGSERNELLGNQSIEILIMNFNLQRSSDFFFGYCTVFRVPRDILGSGGS